MFKLNSKKKFYFLYSGIFALFSLLILFFYYSQGKSLIDFYGDGFRQHYRALLYYADLLKEIFAGLLKDGKLIIPQWDFSIGEGSDILTTLHYYGIGDPVLFLSVFCPDRYMYLFYDISVFVRMYLSGIAFSLLAFYKEKKNYYAVLSGTLLYAFCSFSLVNLSGHTIFLSSLIYLPLTILGTEKIIEGKEPYLLAISVFLSSITSIYFFYINVLLTIVYVLVRLVFMKADLSSKIGPLLKISLWSVLGLLMSFVVFLPMAYTMFSNGRLSETFDNPLFYSIAEYKSLFTSFVFGYGTYTGNHSILALLALIILFRKQKNHTLQTLSIIALIFVSFPFFGRLFNGMVYSSVRWVYGISLLISYIVMEEFDELHELNCFDLIISLIYFLVCLILDRANSKLYLMFVIMELAYFLLLKWKKTKKLSDLFSLGIVLFSLFFSILYRYSPLWWNYTVNGTDIAQIQELTYPDTKLLEQADDSFFRRYSGSSLSTNSSVNNGYYSSQFYWSVANGDVIEFRKQLGLLDHNNHHYDNYDERFALNALSSTRYYISESNTVTPYGFDLLKEVDNRRILESTYALPLMYVYEEAIPYDEWSEMDLLDKNEILTEKVAMDGAKTQDKEQSMTHHVIDSVLAEKDVKIENGVIEALSADAAISLTADVKDQGEYYFVIQGLDSDDSANLLVSLADHEPKLLFFKAKNHTGTADKHDFIVNLGYYDGFNDTVEVCFQQSGTFRYEKIALVCQPLEKQIEDIGHLRDSISFDYLNVDGNTIDAKCRINKDGYLCIAVPYSEGWKAQLDGQDIKIEKANRMYMGFAISKGEHDISMRYETPLLKPAAIISLIGFVAYIALIFFQKENRRSK